jgi:hypothetical protein
MQVQQAMHLQHCYKDEAGDEVCRAVQSTFGPHPRGGAKAGMTILNGPYLVFRDGSLIQFHIDLLHDGDYAKIASYGEANYGSAALVATHGGRETRIWHVGTSTCIAKDEGERVATFDCSLDAAVVPPIDNSY